MASQPVAPDSEVSSFIRAIMPIARNLAASGGRSSNPRERANQFQGPPSGIAVAKTAVMVGHSLHFVFPIPFKNIQQGHSESHRCCLVPCRRPT